MEWGGIQFCGLSYLSVFCDSLYFCRLPVRGWYHRAFNSSFVLRFFMERTEGCRQRPGLSRRLGCAYLKVDKVRLVESCLTAAWCVRNLYMWQVHGVMRLRCEWTVVSRTTSNGQAFPPACCQVCSFDLVTFFCSKASGFVDGCFVPRFH